MASTAAIEVRAVVVAEAAAMTAARAAEAKDAAVCAGADALVAGVAKYAAFVPINR